jgi:3-hydroxyacyl-[acyl-carrier-protein] dehydratase
MPKPFLFDLAEIDRNAEPVFTRTEIDAQNPQRHEMQQLDGVLWYDKDKFLVLGYKDVRGDEFWTRGHIPGRPLMPGVIMIECAAQLLSFFVKQVYEETGFIGFAGIESAKFRSTVVPGQRLYLLGQITKLRKGRRYTAYIQGVVEDTMAFECEVSGMAV